jgi:dephospho-CoA kinase
MWECEIYYDRTPHRKTMQLIGISGKLGSGKTTVAAMIVGANGGTEIAFADAIRTIATTLTCDELFKIGTQDFKNEPCVIDATFSNGELLVKVGTALREHIHPDVFVKALEQKIALSTSDVRGTPYIVVSDVRFKNEAAMVKRLEGKIVRVEGDPAGVRAASKRDPKHPSECELDDYDAFDAIVKNDGTVDDLRNQIVALVQSWQ